MFLTTSVELAPVPVTAVFRMPKLVLACSPYLATACPIVRPQILLEKIADRAITDNTVINTAMTRSLATLTAILAT